jgi:hypothetical protein
MVADLSALRLVNVVFEAHQITRTCSPHKQKVREGKRTTYQGLDPLPISLVRFEVDDDLKRYQTTKSGRE